MDFHDFMDMVYTLRRGMLTLLSATLLISWRFSLASQLPSSISILHAQGRSIRAALVFPEPETQELGISA